MAGNIDNGTRRQNTARKRRRSGGVPVMLTIVLLIIALLMGALAGFAVARRTDTHVHELQAANDRIMELENTLTLIGYPVADDVDPEQWLYDRTANDNALRDLTGSGWDEGEDDLWIDDSVIGATLSDDVDPVVVAEFEGSELLSSEVIPEYNDQLTNQIFAGNDAEAVAEDTLNDVLTRLAGDKVIALRAAELGLTELTADDLAQIDREAAENYEEQISDYIAFAGGDRESAVQSLEENGITPESVAETLKQNWWPRKFFEYIVRDVTVSDDEIQACYDALLAEQRELFTAHPEEFEYAHQTGQLIVFRPDGYRAVRDILIGFAGEGDAEQAARLTEQLEQGLAGEDAEKQLDALYESLTSTVQKAQDALSKGADFSDLMDEYGCDPALRNEPMRSEGYYISDQSYVNSREYVEGSMMLDQPGQVSAPLRNIYGLHLVEYIGDVAPGEVPLSEVRDATAAKALAEKQTAYYEQQRQALLEAAQVKYYPERMR